jgi:glucose/arabinose dehydrogenase
MSGDPGAIRADHDLASKILRSVAGNSITSARPDAVSLRVMKDHELHLSRLMWIVLGSLGVGLALNACGSDDGGDPKAGTGASGNTGGSSGTAGGGTGGDGQGGMGMVVCDEPGGAIPPLQLTQIAAGFDRPVFVTSERANADRLYVLEQTGRIRILDAGVLLDEPFLDVSGLIPQGIAGGDEYGLLGLALHPDYDQNGRFFIYYTRDSPYGFVVAEYRRSRSNPNVADPSTGSEIFTVEETNEAPLYGNHNGGMLAFGPDGYLYIGVGDGGDADDPHNNGQNIDRRLGKILRIDVENPQAPPSGNLPGGEPFIWDYGLRNPWRFSFDRCTGDLYIGDVGQGTWEEIDVELAGQGHKNYGWNIMEGSDCFVPPQGCSMDGLTLPVVQHNHQSGEGESITGGYVYRGNAIPALRGTYLYADFANLWIKTLVWKDGSLISQGDLTDDLQSLDMLTGLASFGEDAAGELYVVDLGGAVFRIEPE